MMEMKIHPKEQAIYEGVLALVSQGRVLSKITVQNIADAAHMGKGTVYEYFTSREEIIAKTIAYRMEQELGQLSAALQQADTFAQKVDALLCETAQAMKSKLSSAQIMLSNLQVDELQTRMNTGTPSCQVFAQRMYALLTQMLQTGVDEGVIAPLPNQQVGLLALSGTVLSFLNALRMMDQTVDEAELRKIEYVILCKALA